MFRNIKKHRLTVFGKRFLACLIVLCMLVSLIPTVIAEGTELVDDAVTDSVTETETEEEPVALSEITEMRDEFSKTFLMSDGTYCVMAHANNSVELYYATKIDS